MKEQIKELRVRIDGLAQLAKELKPVERNKTEYTGPYSKIQSIWKENSKEIEKAVDSLYLAKAWLGKCLEGLGEETPYSSGKKTIEDIESTADSVKILEEEKKYIADKPWQEMNHIEKIDWLRSEIEKIINEVMDKELLYEIDNGLFINNAYTHLCEAKFWLGFELGRIREDMK